MHPYDFKNEFDIVISNASLHWIKDHRTLLFHIYRRLRNGGIARLNFALDGNCSFFFKVVREAMNLEQYAAFFSKFDWPWYMPKLEEYESLVQEFPFVEKRVWGENADRYFPTVGAMIQWIDQPSLVPFLQYLNSVEKDSFREYVIRRMIEETKQSDGTCLETFRSSAATRRYHR